MKYEDSLKLWAAAAIRVVEARHGLLTDQRLKGVDECSLFFYVQGSGQVQIGETPYRLRGAVVFHVGRNVEYSVTPLGEAVEYFIVRYQADCAPVAGRELMRLFLQDNPFARCHAAHASAAMRSCFCTLCDAFQKKTPLGQLRLKQGLYEAACLFFESLTGAEGELDADIPEQVRRYIEDHYAQPNPVQSITSRLNRSRSAVYGQFRERFDVSPQQYLMQKRMEIACDLLRRSDMPIQEVAALCGMRDKDYLSRHFSKRFGMAPGAYRRQNSVTWNREGSKAPEEEQSDRAVGEAKRRLLIENAGRVHRYDRTPQRVVCLNYAAAELCAALGVGDRLVGVAAAEDGLTDCDPQYQPVIRQAPFLQKAAGNVPSFRSIRACAPDLVVGTSYSFQLHGVAEAEEFESRGIHIYALSATCMLGSTFEDVYGDIYHLGRILDREARADELIAAMRAEERLLREAVGTVKAPLKVFSFDTVIADKAYTCGQSLENHMIQSAGGENICAQYPRQFAVVDWREVAEKNPQAILVHRFYDGDDGEEKAAYLLSRPELCRTDAVKNRKILIVGIKKIFPAVDNVRTATEIARWLGA